MMRPLLTCATVTPRILTPVDIAVVLVLPGSIVVQLVLHGLAADLGRQHSEQEQCHPERPVVQSHFGSRFCSEQYETRRRKATQLLSWSTGYRDWREEKERSAQVLHERVKS